MLDMLEDLVTFRLMVTPSLLKAAWLLGWLGISLWGLNMLINGYWAFGLLALVGGTIGWRVLCELLIILFSIHERLAIIEDNTTP